LGTQLCCGVQGDLSNSINTSFGVAKESSLVVFTSVMCMQITKRIISGVPLELNQEFNWSNICGASTITGGSVYTNVGFNFKIEFRLAKVVWMHR
jgi:hypothetical protein